jgi:hypothetical protein
MEEATGWGKIIFIVKKERYHHQIEKESKRAGSKESKSKDDYATFVTARGDGFERSGSAGI